MMGRPRVAAATSRTSSPGRVASASAAAGKERMVHIRVSPELHRKLRLIVAAQDTTLQDWIEQTLENAAHEALPDTEREETP